MSARSHALLPDPQATGGYNDAMTLSNSPQLPDHIRSLIPLGTYEWPRSEVEQTIGHLFEKLKSGLGAKKNDTVIDPDKLENKSDEALRATLQDALQTVLLEALDATYLDWFRSSENTRTRQVLVHPPMDADILSAWGERHGIPVLSDLNQLREHPPETCFILPKMEMFFGRRVEDLNPLFGLFEELAAHEGHVLLGCNSWGRVFLEQFDEKQLLLGTEDTFPPFDADALAHVLERALGPDAEVKSVSSGDFILKRDDDGQLVDSFLKKLAEESLGHPWVAVEMFLQGMAEAADTDETTSGSQLWVKLPAACSLPTPTNDAHLFALHTLLIHGSRQVDELSQLLPNPSLTGVWLSLQRNGFVNVNHGHVSCAIRSYPDIRSELGAAGFNLDRL